MKKKRTGYDEVFKDTIRYYFEGFAIVKPEYEIHRLPRKIDILIIEAEHSIKDYVVLFTYFKKYNIIEFKSEADNFELEDLYKTGYYIYALLTREYKEIYHKNLTYTLVCTEKPNLLFEELKPKKLKKGLYVLKELSIIEIKIVVIDELEEKLEKEVKYLKMFSGKEKRRAFLEWLIEKESEEYMLMQTMILYGEEMMKIAKEKGYYLSGTEERVEELTEIFGVKERLIKIGIEKGTQIGIEKGTQIGIEKGTQIGFRKSQRLVKKEKLKTTIRLKKSGMTIEFISNVMEIKQDWLERFFNKVKL